MKYISNQRLLFCLLVVSSCFNSFITAQNLQLTRLLQVNASGGQSKVLPNYLKGHSDGSVYSNVIISGDVDYFGNSINIGNNEASIFSKLNPAGNLLWHAYLTSSNISSSSYDMLNSLDLNAQDEAIYAVKTFDNSSFHSSNGIITPLPDNSYEVIKISNNGELQWKKSIVSVSLDPKVFCFYDNNGDVIIWLGQNQGADILLDSQLYNSVTSFIAKLNGQTGDIIYLKQFEDLDPWIGSIAFDEDNNMYAFYEPYTNHNNNIYHIGNIQINGNDDKFNFFMLKFDASGNPIFGKNFYDNVPAGTFKYSWANDVEYDGNNFSVYEVLAGSGTGPNISLLGLNGTYYPNPYPDKNIANAISKVSKTGVVLSTTPIFTLGLYDVNQFGVDQSGNSYIYGRWDNKITIGNTEYPMNMYSSNIIKFNSNGILSYIEPIVQNSFSDYNQKISVISENRVFISGNTTAQSIKNHPINTPSVNWTNNYYIGELQSATLGIQNYSKDEIKVFPNPAYDFIQVESNKELSVAKIYDLSGKLIATTPILFNKIEVAHLLSGNYILEIFDKTHTLIVSKKILKK